MTRLPSISPVLVIAAGVRLPQSSKTLSRDLPQRVPSRFSLGTLMKSRSFCNDDEFLSFPSLC